MTLDEIRKLPQADQLDALMKLPRDEFDRFCLESEMALLNAMIQAGFTVDEMNEINQSILDAVCPGAELSDEAVH